MRLEKLSNIKKEYLLRESDVKKEEERQTDINNKIAKLKEEIAHKENIVSKNKAEKQEKNKTIQQKIE